MTWEVDIVQRAGKLSVVGQFKINDAREATSFMNAGNQEYTAKQIKACTERCKAKAMQAVEP